MDRRNATYRYWQETGDPGPINEFGFTLPDRRGTNQGTEESNQTRNTEANSNLIIAPDYKPCYLYKEIPDLLECKSPTKIAYDLGDDGYIPVCEACISTAIRLGYINDVTMLDVKWLVEYLDAERP